MRALAWSVLVVVAAGIVIAEYAMDLTPMDRTTLYAVFGAMAVLTAVTSVAALRWAPRLRSLLTSLRIVALAAVVVAAGVVAAAAVTMFIEPHDLTLVMVALLLGVGLGGVVAVAVASPLTEDLERLAETARRIGEGNLDARTGIDRRDELGEAAAAFDAMTIRMEEALEGERAAEAERRHLVAAVGHDLRTPLASLQASIEAIDDGMVPNPGPYLRGMVVDIEHLRRLVDDLFLLARIDAGTHRIEPQTIDLAELVDEAVEAMTPLARSRGMALTADTDGPIPVWADPAAVGRIIRNLVDNALRHGPEGSVVALALTGTEETARLTVTDRGAGFPPEHRSTFFEQDRRDRVAEGSGLGLTIAQELAGLCGGLLDLPQGSGGIVRLSIPVRQP